MSGAAYGTAAAATGDAKIQPNCTGCSQQAHQVVSLVILRLPLLPPPIANGDFPAQKSSTERMTIQRQNAPMLPQCAFSGFLPNTAG